ncbi:DUF3575 domain-containing protein [Prevotella sp. 10(H)]|uniref:DUF3575 domain-containing protein n=1 Tax=Prevotella sp. 10(H) TaxID=1158294 RepID=UPI000691FAE2|nr:DUF3575 domain-containing protein [Prevotella sp. 10(H)]
MKQKIITFILLLLLCFPSLNAQENKEAEQTYFPKGSLSLRTNAASWLLLTPNLGAEYKATDNLGLLVEGGYAHWKLNTQNRYWHVWNVAPQVRYYTGSLKNNYIGLQYTMGEYNLTGNQGKYMGGGLTLGHQFYCGRNLMVDLGLSLGYLYLHDKEEYNRIDGHDYRIKAKSSNGYWGPTGVSVTFVWKM